MWLRLVMCALFGVCGGVVTAAGYFAVINSIGMMNRAASVTCTRDRILMYEDVIVLGVVCGTYLSLSDNTLELGVAGVAVGVVYGLFAGMFIGLFVVSLAENVKAIPIFVKRTGISRGLGLVILFIAIGKAVGHIVFNVALDNYHGW